MLLEYQNIKTFLQRAYCYIFQIRLQKFLQLTKVKNTVPWSYVISNLNVESK